MERTILKRLSRLNVALLHLEIYYLVRPHLMSEWVDDREWFQAEKDYLKAKLCGR